MDKYFEFRGENSIRWIDSHMVENMVDFAACRFRHTSGRGGLQTKTSGIKIIFLW